LIDGTQRAFVSDLSPARLKGTALGTFHTFTGLAALPAGYIAGELWTKIGSEATFLFGAIIGTVSILIFCCSLGNYKINQTIKTYEQ
jgi:MFS family permease